MYPRSFRSHSPRSRSPSPVPGKTDPVTAVKRLHLCIQHLSAQDCRQWMDAGADMNALYRGKTALGLAMELGRSDLTSDILSRAGLRVDVRDSQNCTALWLAAMYGRSDAVVALIGKGASVNAIDRFGQTPLHATCYHDNADVAYVLIDNGAEVDYLDRKGMTPLNLAASTLAVGVCQVLLTHGADVNTRAGESRPLMTSLRHNTRPNVLQKARKLGVMRALISCGADVDGRDRTGDGGHRCTCLHYAVITGQIEAASLLMSCGCGVDISDNRQVRPLDEALLKDDLEMTMYLLVFGCDGSTPSRWLIGTQNPLGLPLLFFLFKKRRFVKTMSKKRLLPFMVRAANLSKEKSTDIIARIQRSTKVSPKLREMAMDAVNTIAERELFYTALQVIRNRIKRCKPLRMDMLAAIDTLPLPNVMKSMLALGLDLKKDHPWHACQLHSAVATGVEDRILEVLYTGVGVNVILRAVTPLITAVRNARRDDRTAAENVRVTKNIITLLTERGADINAANEFGETALQAAAQTGQVHIVEWLIQHGADINCKNYRGQSPAELAARAGCFKAVLALMKHGVTVLDMPSSGLPLLHVAAGAGNPWVVERLLEAGMDVHALDVYGNTALHVAGTAGQLYLNVPDPPVCIVKVGVSGISHHDDVVRLLLAKGCDVKARNHENQSAAEAAATCFNSQDHLATLLREAEAVDSAPTAGATCSKTSGESADRNEDPVSRSRTSE